MMPPIAGTSTIGLSRSATTSGAAEEWKQPRNPVRAPRRPTPSSTTMGDYLPKSVFTRAAKVEGVVSNRPEEEDSDNEDWVTEFEARYTDVSRLQPK